MTSTSSFIMMKNPFTADTKHLIEVLLDLYPNIITNKQRSDHKNTNEDGKNGAVISFEGEFAAILNVAGPLMNIDND